MITESMKEQMEKSDGLDIVSIGKLYDGPWEKKYWSSSRGKDRHPYPVGYVAHRANNGNTYKMAILEGLKGPEFVISSTDGQSCSGQTPDIAWEGFQKKSSVRIKFWRGKRFSCKIDGAELFGFKNPQVMRLLRGLKANVSEISQNSSPSLAVGKGQSEGADEHHTKYPDLQVNSVKVKGKEKRSNKRKEIHVKSVSGPGRKRERPQDLIQSGQEPHTRQSFEGGHNNGVLSSSSNWNESNTSHLLPTEDGIQVDLVISSDHLEKEKHCSVQEAITEEGAKLSKSQENHKNAFSQHDLSKFNRAPGFTSSKDEKEDPPLQKESQMLDDMNLYAPDTLDLTLDSLCNLEVEIPKESTCTLNEKLNFSQILVSEQCITDSQSKDETGIATGGDLYDKSDSDPAGQDISNSMMALLLPRALPLLKTFSRKKKKNTNGVSQKERKEVDQFLKDEPPAKSSEHLENLSGEVNIPDKPSTENFKFEKQDESVLFTSTNMDSVVPGLEDSTTVAPDSFEDDQCEVMDAVKDDQSTSTIDSCTREVLHELEASVDNMSSMLTVDQKVDGLTSVLQGQRISQHHKTNMVHNIEEPNVAPNDEIDNIFELVGCYMLPTPISMVMLRTKGDEVVVCVLCGYLMENKRALFIYKTSIKGETKGCPSFIGHTTIISPTSMNASGKQVILDSSRLQFTPDGKSIVLLNSIKAPYCREGNVNCGCSLCTSDCLEKNAVKIVQVKLGYVQVLCKLKTTDNVCSVLVCEPNYLVASEESGKMNLWTMNSSWSAPTDESFLSTYDCMPNCIIEMKRIPKSPSFIVGHSAFGDFCLWDLTRRTLISKFSAPTTSFLPFIPICLYRHPSQLLSTSDACRKKQVEDIMEETNNPDFLPVNDEQMSLVLLVSSASNHDPYDEYSCKDTGFGPAGSWSLALLAKSKLVTEKPLDPSATVVGASSGYGIIGTCDGSLYIWELSTGTKVGYLRHCKGATVSCLAADDSDFGVFAVAVDGNQLQVYASRTLTDRKT